MFLQILLIVMSIIISDLTYHFPGQHPIFSHLSFSVANQNKISIVGHNGIGKSTLLRLMAGSLQPDRGSILQSDYDILAGDWEIESRYHNALSYWHLSHIKLDMQIDMLSGGEKTKIFLAALLIHAPEIILLDEPTNHLDRTGRELLYQYIRQSNSTIVVVSHDITLLNQLQTTYELSEQGIKLYGGNYDFYKRQKEITVNALDRDIHEGEKTLRLARKKAQEIKQRQEKRAFQGEKGRMQGGGARILLNALGNSAENTASKLQGKYVEIISDNQEKLTELRRQREQLTTLKIDFDNTSLHAGKLLIEMSDVNFIYKQSDALWKTPVNFKLYSNDRVHLSGDNGSGKTTFIKLLTGILSPSSGKIKHTCFKWIYLDQDYTPVNVDCTIDRLAQKYNLNNLKKSEVKIRLNRFLFSSDTWNKNCLTLSGGEKMRLYLCCLMINNQTPDLIILDEPTNNLDIANLQILAYTIKNYKGSLLVISHDQYFINEIGITGNLVLNRF